MSEELYYGLPFDVLRKARILLDVIQGNLLMLGRYKMSDKAVLPGPNVNYTLQNFTIHATRRVTEVYDFMNVTSEYSTNENFSDESDDQIPLTEADLKAILILYSVLGCVVGALAVVGFAMNVLSMIVFSRVTDKSASIFLLQILAAADCAFLISNLLIYTVLAVFLLSGESEYYLLNVAPSLPYISSFEEVSRDFAVWMVVLVTLERYLAIYYPLKANNMCRSSATAKIVIVLLFCVSLFNIPSFLIFQRSDDTLVIAPFADTLVYNMTYYILDCLINLVAPIILVLVFNIRIISVIRLTRRRRFSCDSLESSSSSNQIHFEDSRTSSVTKTLIIISIIFVFCEVPHLVYLVWDILSRSLPLHYPTWLRVLTASLSVIFLNVNSFINFFIYILMARKFRSTLRIIFWNCPKQLRRRSHRNQYPVCTSFV